MYKAGDLFLDTSSHVLKIVQLETTYRIEQVGIAGSATSIYTEEALKTLTQLVPKKKLGAESKERKPRKKRGEADKKEKDLLGRVKKEVIVA
jgi:hypothetical protein